jgi:branched-chain amino acid transport system ATP-binding protein
MTDALATTAAPRQPQAAGAPLLSVRGVKTYYGNIIALKGVDLDVRR